MIWSEGKKAPQLPKLAPRAKKAGSESQGLSRRLRWAGVLVIGSFLDQSARAIADRHEVQLQRWQCPQNKQIFNARLPMHSLEPHGSASATMTWKVLVLVWCWCGLVWSGVVVGVGVGVRVGVVCVRVCSGGCAEKVSVSQAEGVALVHNSRAWGRGRAVSAQTAPQCAAVAVPASERPKTEQAVRHHEGELLSDLSLWYLLWGHVRQELLWVICAAPAAAGSLRAASCGCAVKSEPRSIHGQRRPLEQVLRKRQQVPRACTRPQELSSRW